MRLTEFIAAHVGQTSLDPVLIKGFLQTLPHYHQWGVIHGLNQTVLDQLNATDLFEFYLRQYLSGRHKTLYAVLREARASVRHNPTEGAYFIEYSLSHTRQQLLALEWYELLPRWETARQRIVQLVPAINYSVRVSSLTEID